MDKIKNYILWPILAIASLVSVYLILVSIVHKILINSSLEQEEFLWEYILSNASYQNVDLKKQQEIQNIVDNLPPTFIPKRYKKLKIIVINSNEVNAFAAPGGRIIITTGLLEQNLSFKALLFVIGHEISHLNRGDHLYEFSKMIVAKYYALITGSEILKELLMLSDNTKLKKTEYIADKYSAKLIYSYFNNIDGAKEFFNYLVGHNNYEQSSSHPGAMERWEKISAVNDY